MTKLENDETRTLISSKCSADKVIFILNETREEVCCTCRELIGWLKEYSYWNVKKKFREQIKKDIVFITNMRRMKIKMDFDNFELYYSSYKRTISCERKLH